MNPLSLALAQINKRWCSTQEIEDNLRKKGFEEGEIGTVIFELKDKDLLNDRRFAKAWVHDRDLFSPRGEYLLRRELEEKGVSAADINFVLSQREDENPDIEREMALRVLEVKAGRYQNVEDLKQKKRKSDLLLRRGFSFDLIRRILNM